MNPLSDDQILVVGGSGALGHALVPTLLSLGAKPFIADLKRPSDSPFGAIPFYEMDATRPETIEACRVAMEKDGRRLSHVVNIVGGLAETGLTDMFKTSAEEIERTIDLNLKSQLFVVRYLGQHLAATNAPNKSFVLISSINANAGYSIPFYSAAKGALHSFIRPAAIELGRGNVRINIVSPGSVKTPSTEKQPKNFEARAAAAALGRLCSPAEVADAIVACLSLTGMTGQEIVVDAGQSINPSQSLYDQRRTGLVPSLR